jgi:maltooligosyltrehalose trehalohydrolase
MAAHAMPFGAALSRGGVRFRLWAPGATRVEVKLEGAAPRLLAMAPAGGGWFQLRTRAAQAGTLYRYRVDGEVEVPDPASRYQPQDVHGPSQVVDPAAYRWRHPDWRGRPWTTAVIYELHTGTFTAAGTFAGVEQRLGHLARLGVTAVELMPVADFPGRRNWGYDGVLPFAPEAAYGRPEDLKRLVDAAHGLGLMVLLDVVYNHFGPEGNYLHRYAPQFFSARKATPWGPAVDFRRREVRAFFVHNALYWLQEYRCDGLRLDAVHAMVEDAAPGVLEELARAVRRHCRGRHVHLVLENDRNQARLLRRGGGGAARRYDAQWNDDAHHALHVLATGERAGYYADYAADPAGRLGRALTEGFAYQGEPSGYRGGAARGEPSAQLPPWAFVNFLQNHDQVGNRALGERLTRLAGARARRALSAVLLLGPSPPLLFMGEEWGATEPFLFFCDFHDELAAAVRAGRRREFARFPEFGSAAARRRIPDPNAAATFRRSRLRWERRRGRGQAAWLAWTRRLLALRRREIVPRLPGMAGHAGRYRRFGAAGLEASWQLGDGTRLVLVANLAPRGCRAAAAPPEGRLLLATHRRLPGPNQPLPAWFAAWFLAAAEGA